VTGNSWSLVNFVSQLLEPAEREAVQGDLAEAGETPWQGFRDVLGLVVSRQALLWKNWRPWVATFGVVLPGSLLLMGLSLRVSGGFQLYAWIIGNRQFIDPKLLQETGLSLGSGVSLLACRSLLLIARSWTAGFVVGSMSRRTVWVSALSSLLPCFFCLARFRGPSVSKPCLLLFLIPAIWGVRQGLRVTRINRSSAITLALGVAALMIPTWSGGNWWIIDLALTWPAWYMVATARRPQGGGELVVES
jgi:hypothetical protein